MSRPDRRKLFMSLFWFDQGVIWVGILCPFSMFCISLFWPGMVLNQEQLSIVVSDWEPYLGRFFPPMFCGWLFSVSCSAPDRTVLVSFCTLLFLFQCSV